MPIGIRNLVKSFLVSNSLNVPRRILRHQIENSYIARIANLHWPILPGFAILVIWATGFLPDHSFHQTPIQARKIRVLLFEISVEMVGFLLDDFVMPIPIFIASRDLSQFINSRRFLTEQLRLKPL